MKQPKKRIIFSTEARDFDETKAEMIERHLEDYPDEKDWAPSDEEVYDERHEQTDFDWENAEYELKKHLLDFDWFLVVGSCGLWNGNFAGGKFCKNLSEIMQCMKSCDDYEIYDENGRLHIDGWHHDGKNSFECKALTSKGLHVAGEEGFENYRSLHEKLWKSNLFTKDLHFAHDVYGCKKREYEKEDK